MYVQLFSVFRHIGKMMVRIHKKKKTEIYRNELLAKHKSDFTKERVAKQMQAIARSTELPIESIFLAKKNE
jgi:cytochrome c-type biogenesis protein CcmE